MIDAEINVGNAESVLFGRNALFFFVIKTKVTATILFSKQLYCIHKY